ARAETTNARPQRPSDTRLEAPDPRPKEKTHETTNRNPDARRPGVDRPRDASARRPCVVPDRPGPLAGELHDPPLLLARTRALQRLRRHDPARREGPGELLSPGHHSGREHLHEQRAPRQGSP